MKMMWRESGKEREKERDRETERNTEKESKMHKNVCRENRENSAREINFERYRVIGRRRHEITVFFFKLVEKK